MTGSSALHPLFIAIAAALNADTAFDAVMTGRVFSLTAPRGAVMPYLVLGDVNTTGFSVFARAGESSAITMHLWFASQDSSELLSLYGEMHRVLNLKPLLLPNHIVCTGELRFITVTPDSDGESAHGVLQYRPLTLPK